MQNRRAVVDIRWVAHFSGVTFINEQVNTVQMVIAKRFVYRKLASATSQPYISVLIKKCL